MKKIILRLFFIGLISTQFLPVFSCNLSYIVLDSITSTGPNFNIYITACFGAGVTGVNRGGDSGTRDIVFGFYTPGAVPVSFLSFGPPILTGDTTGCQLTGLDAGPQGAPFFSQGTIAFLDFLACPAGYLCVTGTALCGNVHTQCTQFSFTVDVMPDSVRLFGAEGAGNPVAGCTPDQDQLIDFTTLPVTWGGFEATKMKEAVQLDWTTVSESNNELFVIERAGKIKSQISAHGKCMGTECEDGDPKAEVGFRPVGSVAGAGDAQSELSYTFLDESPLYGQSYYRLRQIDFDGKSSYSSVVEVYFQPESDLTLLNLYPNPANDVLNVEWSTLEERPINLTIFDLKGSVVYSGSFNSSAGIHRDQILLELPNGLYTLRIGNGEKYVARRFVKL